MKLNKLFTILVAAAVILGFAGCKNDLTLAEKLTGKGGESGASGKSEELYLWDQWPVYVGYDKTTGKITDAWMIFEEVFGSSYKYCIPSIEDKNILTGIIGDESSKTISSSDTENYNKITTIINNNSNSKYDVLFGDNIKDGTIQGLLFTKNKQVILSALRKNVDLVLPSEIENNDLLFLYHPVFDFTSVFDCTTNKTYSLERVDNNTALLQKGSESVLKKRYRNEFPDNSTVEEVTNESEFHIAYISTSEDYSLLKVVGLVDKLFKTADGKYIRYIPMGGA